MLNVIHTLQLSPFDWQYKTEKVDNANLAMDGVSRWPRGKVLGGSSMLNYMIYMRGHRYIFVRIYLFIFSLLFSLSLSKIIIYF